MASNAIYDEVSCWKMEINIKCTDAKLDNLALRSRANTLKLGIKMK